MLQHVIFTYRSHLGGAEMMVRDLSDEQMVQQPTGLVNHPAWTLGHLVQGSDHVAHVLGLDSMFPAEWEEKFKTGGIPSGERSYPPKGDLIAALSAQHERVSKAVAEADPATFATPFPDENFRKVFPTIGDFALFMMTSHEGNHVGQLAAWRRAMGMPVKTYDAPVVIKVQEFEERFGARTRS